MVAGIWQTGRRIIPAHAGQTPPSTTRDTCRPDHPRACGANKGAFAQTLSADGSSPRMRGKLFHNCSVLCFVRIIPAHAGQTRSDYQNGDTQPDHPRACGANARRRDCRRAIYGSSPRMRGKPEHRHPGHGHRRIIPAHAGQTCGGRRGPACSADHPRACGANIGVDVSDAFGCGSSPRMRGKLPCARSGRRLRRIIPAHAGQTTS